MLRSLLISVCLFIHFIGYTQSDLYVINPLEWGNDNGTIEDAQFTIHPKGIYMEVGMYLTFSARAADVEIENIDTNLESILNFRLPNGSMITDSWLWINDDIIQADIEERWEASRIYNEIVGARRDPSLLTKDTNPWIPNNEGDRFSLRVYPLEADSTRRVKITYLVPGNWRNGKVSIPLPVDILNASKFPVENISIQCFLDTGFSNPTIPQLPNRAFLPVSHETLGNHFQLILTKEDKVNDIDISLDVSMEDGYFLSNFKDEIKDYYQLAILPQEVLLDGPLPPRKIAFLLDYDSTTTTLSKEFLLNTLQQQLINNLGPNDEFNILFFTADGLQVISPNWMPANEQSIQIVFNLIEEAYTLDDKTHLPLLLKGGIDFIQENDNQGDLLLISCADQFYNEDIAESFVSTISDQLIQFTNQLHIVDYQNKNQSGTYYLGSDNQDYKFFGNEYFYTLLREQVNGYTHVSRGQKTLNALLENSLNAISPIQEVKDIKISNQENNCFNAITLPKSFFGNPNLPLLQVGKCAGNFPLTIEVSGKINNQIVSKKITITEEAAHKGTDNHIVSWTGNYLLGLEKHKNYYTLTQSIVNEVIKRSKEYRVLSIYTAFLALEVNQGGFVCEGCIDETNLDQPISDIANPITNPSINDVDIALLGFNAELRDGTTWTLPPGDSILTATEQILLDTIAHITASPNPFQMGTNISISFKGNEQLEQAAFTIYDINGRKVKTLQAMTAIENNKIQLYWDGTDDQQQRLASGIYFFHIQTSKGQASYKLVLMSN